MPFPDLSGLPVWGQVIIYVILGVSIAIALIVARFGVLQGSKASPGAVGQAQVAAVIVDPTALNKAADEVAGLAVAVTEATVVARGHTASTDRLTDKLGQLIDGIDDLRTEVIRAAAKVK